MGKGISGFGLFLSLLWACHQPPDEKKIARTQFLSPDSLEMVLENLHLLESTLLVSGIRQDTAFVLFDSLQRRTLKNLKVDTTTLNNSLKYYSKNVELLDSIYRRIEKKVQHKFDSLQKLKNAH